MRSGKLDKTITLQRSSETIGADGTPAFVWTDLATVRAELIEASTEEFIRAYGASDETIVIFRLRYIEFLTTADRVLFDGVVHNIKQTTEIRRRKGLELRTTAWTGS